ncbi:MAG TPA: FHA domain-containing protein [Polyangiaceae bacterium]|jgi:pSer/pThr/pTyr-binding forkhead associated (FHA) protein|nr:FHA domain-containing protein [Polyangiaceae bacterium]
MDIVLGVACGRCDRYNVLGAEACSCGHALALAPVVPSSKPAKAADPVPLPSPSASGSSKVAEPVLSPSGAGRAAPPSLFENEILKPRRIPSAAAVKVAAAEAASVPRPAPPTAARAQPPESGLSSTGAAVEKETEAGRAAGGELSLEERMEQAKNYVCRSCSTPVPLSHKFCGRCGAAIPPDIMNARTQFFGQLQTPGKAKLILIRGEGVEGLSYQLNAEQHLVGRNGQLVFPDDPYVSPRHANLFYRAGKLIVRDEGSLNGVFWRVRGSIDISNGDLFLAGEQLFRIEGPPRPNDGPAPDGTYFYTSPKHQTQFKISQVLEGGGMGMAVSARGNALQIGREGGDLNFPGDLYMSASHCKIEELGGKLTLTDLNSRNGTYVRLKAERELANGDYLFIGRKLLRVEITPN